MINQANPRGEFLMFPVPVAANNGVGPISGDPLMFGANGHLAGVAQNSYTPPTGVPNPEGVGVQLIGVILCAAGIAIAIWARVYLGRNWSGTPSIKEGHELVTSGPYRFVRHPIYTGMILAFLGSALVAGIIWSVVFLFFTINFLYRIPVEERYMTQLFPDQYPEYKKKTRALVPFIW